MTDLVSWKEDLKKQAQEVTKVESGGEGPQKISFKGGRIALGDRTVAELDVVVVDFCVEKAYFDKDYDPDKFYPPRCFALGEEEKDMVPHDDVPDPVSERCKGCDLAEFGSASRGKGPACKTRRRLAVLPRQTSSDGYADAEFAWCSVPPTSVKYWAKYAKKLGHSGLPPWAAITRITCEPGKFMFDVKFDLIEPVRDEACLAAIHGRIEEGRQVIHTPYSYEEEEGETNY